MQVVNADRERKIGFLRFAGKFALSDFMLDSFGDCASHPANALARVTDFRLRRQAPAGKSWVASETQPDLYTLNFRSRVSYP